MAAGYRQYFFATSPIMWLSLQPLATRDLPPEWVDTVEMQAPWEGCRTY